MLRSYWEYISLPDIYPDRTGTGIKSTFGINSSFDIKSFTFINYKKMFTRGIIEELLWFKIETDNKKLIEKNVHIWDKIIKILDSLGFKTEKGDIGQFMDLILDIMVQNM